MENRAHALIAGLFVVLFGAAVLAAATWLAGETHERVNYVLESRHSVSGLNVQATVRLRGVAVGKVDGIRFDPEDPRRILIGISVDSGTPITRGTVAFIAAQGVTGLAYVQLEDDGKLPERLPPIAAGGARIPVQPSLFDELTGSGKDLVVEFAALAARLNQLLSEKNQGQLLKTLAALDTAAERVAAMARAFEPAAASVPRVAADARKVLANADELVASLKDLTGQIARRVDTFDRVAASAEQVGSATQAATGALREEALPRISALLDELTRVSQNLDRLVAELKDQPQSLVFGRPPPPPGPGEPGFQPPRGSVR